MSESLQIERLLKNIQQGLKKYSLSELNRALLEALSKRNDKSDEIQYVLKIVSNDYCISEYALKNTKKRGDLHEAKQIAYCLLYFNVGLSIRDIATNVFSNGHTSVANGVGKLKKANIEHKQDRKFLERYYHLQTKFLTYIQNKNNQSNEIIP